MKIISIVGARPQFIKSAQFSKEIRKKHHELIIHTGQHYDENMSDIFFTELEIPKPDYNLNIGSGTHGKQTGMMIDKIEEVLLYENPDAVVIFGDTNSTLAGAIAAGKLHIPIYHIEAGLRSFNMRMPEEQNRVLSDHLSTLLFCPTDTAITNLNNEGIKNGVYNVGDIMYDAILDNLNRAKSAYTFDKINSEYSALLDRSISLCKQGYYLATIHRADNTADIETLMKILNSFEKLEFPVLIPMHPRTRHLLNTRTATFKNILIINPVGYLLMLFLTYNSKMVITDSGGLQKEAFLLKVPCTTIRSETEWIETLENRWNVLSDINEVEMIEKINRKDIGEYPKDNPFGFGDSAIRIVEIIEKENLK